MKQIFETYLTLFLMLMAVFTLEGIIAADIDIKNARDFKESIVDEIENSNFSPTVIAECRNAGNSKYTVTVDEYKDNENNTVMAEVTVSYNYSIPFLNVNKQHELKDFAECGLCGTAAVISPVGKVVDHGKEICFPSGMEKMGPITQKLYDTLTGIQYGKIEAPEGWIHEIM